MLDQVICLTAVEIISPMMWRRRMFRGQWLKGVMEAIRISCAGFPTKTPFVEFIDRFGILAPEILDGRHDYYLSIHFVSIISHIGLLILIGFVIVRMRLPFERGFWRKWDLKDIRLVKPKCF